MMHRKPGRGCALHECALGRLCFLTCAFSHWRGFAGGLWFCRLLHVGGAFGAIPCDLDIVCRFRLAGMAIPTLHRCVVLQYLLRLRQLRGMRKWLPLPNAPFDHVGRNASHSFRGACGACSFRATTRMDISGCAMSGQFSWLFAR